MALLNKVVFVDDDNYTNEYHKRFTQKHNLANEVVFFERGEDALKYLDGITEKYDFPELILADINMPGMNGHQFVESVADTHGFNPLRTMVAFLTASKDAKDMVKADEENVEFYYWKPLDERLLRRILKDGFGIEKQREDGNT